MSRVSSPFPRVPLSERVFFQEGPGLRQWQWTSEGMKVINVTNILGDGSVNVSNTDKFISMVEFEDRYRHFAVEDGDIVVASSGNTYGKVGKIVPDNLPLMMNTSVIRFHPLDKRQLCESFLYAFLRSADFKNQIEQFVTGGAQPNFGPSHLKQMSIPNPPPETQQRIGEVVCGYDDLIENNRRRIQLLEDSARLLYREWFVHLRFPGHEHLRVVDGLPEDWQRRTYDDVCHAIGGGTPSTSVSEYWDGTITWVTPSDITANDCLYLRDSSRKITDAGLANSSAKMLPANAILMTSRASIGYFALANRPVCTNQGFIAVVPKIEGSRSYLLFEMMARVEEFRSRASGSTFKELSKGTFRELPIIWPTVDLLASHDNVVAPTISQIQALAVMNSKLAQARDLLLPRLMSGEIQP